MVGDRSPQVFPILRAPHVVPINGLISQFASHLGNRPVVVGVLDRSVAGPLVGDGDVAERTVVGQPAPPLLALVGAGGNFAVPSHGPQGPTVVDSSQPLGAGVRDHDIGIASPLGPAVAVAAAGVRQVGVVLRDIDQRSDDGDLGRFPQQRQEGVARAKGVPERVKVVIIGFIRLPFRIFARLVSRRKLGVVKRGVECAVERAIAPLYGHRSQGPAPRLGCRGADRGKIPARVLLLQVVARLLAPEVRYADLHLHRAI